LKFITAKNLKTSILLFNRYPNEDKTLFILLKMMQT